MIKITSVDEAIGSSGLKILVHGQAGAGKTMLAATTGKPTLIISAEAGLLSIQGAPSYIQTTVVESVSDVEDVHKYLVSTKHDFEWVILDSITEIAEACLSKELKENSDPRKSYPAFQNKMGDIIRKFRDLKGMNVMMTCKQLRKEDSDSGVTRYSPMMPGNKLGAAIPYWFDLVMALRVEKNAETKDLERMLQTFQDLKYEAKDRSGILDQFEEPSLEKILAKVSVKLDMVKAKPYCAEKDLFFYDEENGVVITIKEGDEVDPSLFDSFYNMDDEEHADYLKSIAPEPVDPEPLPEEVVEVEEVECEIVALIAKKVTYIFDEKSGTAEKYLKGKELPEMTDNLSEMSAKDYLVFVKESKK